MMTSLGLEIIIKMSSLLSVSNSSSKLREFSLNDIEVLVDSEEQNWFKRADVGKFLGLKKILMYVGGLDIQETSQRDDIKAMISNTYPWPGLKITERRRITSSQSLG